MLRAYRGGHMYLLLNTVDTICVRYHLHGTSRYGVEVLRVYPVVEWSDLGVTATFEEDAGGGSNAATTVVVFARHPGGFVLAAIPGRGWCTPSGHIEPHETHLDAALRETREEIGAELRDVRIIGRFLLTNSSGVRSAAIAFVGRVDTFGDLPAHTEATAVRVVPPEDLPSVYYRWDELLSRVFAYAERLLAAIP